MRGPRLEGGSGGQLFRSCLTGCGERRPTRRPPGRLEPGGGGGAVLSPTAAGRGVLPDTGRGRAALLRCPRSGPGPCGGGAKGRAFSLGRFLLDAALRALLSQSLPQDGCFLPVLGALGHCRALPRMARLCPCPALSALASGARTHFRLHTQLADRFLWAVFAPWGLLASRRVYIILRFVRASRGFVFCTSTVLYFSHANTEKRTAAEEQTGYHD